MLNNLRVSPTLSGFVAQDIARTRTTSQTDRKIISADLQQENTQDSIAGAVLVKLDGETGTGTATLER